jgi:ferredoxin
MATGILLSVALNEARDIYVSPTFCKRVRFRKNNCQRCVEFCPENAISLNPGPIINSACTDCGLCLNACPTEAFRPELHTDRYLMNQARKISGKNRRQHAAEKKRFYFHCHRAEKRNNNSIGLQCLGRITANMVLDGVLAGFDEAVLTRGICSQCRFQDGEKLLANSITVSRVLIESTGLDRFAISIKEKEKNKEVRLDRREIFSIISAKVKDKAASFLSHREKAIREKLTQGVDIKTGKRLLPQHESLRKFLKQNRPGNKMVVKYNSDFPWGKIKISQNKCSACGTCVSLCPMGAIFKKMKDEYQLLYFDSSLCTNCALCRAACPENAIGFEDEFALADIIAEEETVVAAIQLSTCTICGERIAAQKHDVCPTCRKRQTWPMYVKV